MSEEKTSTTQFDADDIRRYMREHQLVLVTAESCTAGLIAATIADLEGAGQLLECGFVTYDPRAKIRCLGVRSETIDRFGLTSEAVAGEMAAGALRCSTASVAIANVGVVDDVDPQLPAGTQCLAWAFDRGEGLAPEVVTETQRFSGDRREMRERVAQYALSSLPRMHARLNSSGQGGSR